MHNIMRPYKKAMIPLAFVTTGAGIVAVFAGLMIPVIAVGGLIAGLAAGTRAGLRPLLCFGLLALLGWGLWVTGWWTLSTGLASWEMFARGLLQAGPNYVGGALAGLAVRHAAITLAQPKRSPTHA